WMKEHHGLAVTVNDGVQIPPLADELKLLLFESVRELLLNVVKHANVKSTELNVEVDDNQTLRLTVSDRGAGFDLHALKPAGPNAGFGLFSIRERIELLGGRVAIETA